MISLAEVQPALALFAEAMSGEPVAFTGAADEAPCWPDRNTLLSTASHTITLAPEQRSRRECRVIVLHRSLRAASLDFGEPGPGTELVFELFGWIEDHRVNAVIRDQFPGAGDDLDRVYSHVRSATASQRRPGTQRDRRPVATEVVTLVHAHVVGGINERSRDEQLGLDVVQFVSGELERVTHPGATSESSLDAARRIAELIVGLEDGRSASRAIEDLPPVQEPVVPTEQPSGVSLDGGTPDEFTDGQGGAQMLGELDGAHGVEADEDKEQVDGAGLRLPGPGQRSAANKRTYVYDEWDYHQQRFRTGWCRVIEESLVGDDQDFITDVRRRHQGLRSQIRRRLMNMRPEELVRIHRSNDGEELDIDAAIEAIADRRSGARIDERLHVRRDRAARDIATAFLVDLSASTSSPAVPPQPERVPETDPMDDPLSYGPIWSQPPQAAPVRRVIDVAKDAVALMGDALQGLGDRYAIYGFSGSGRDNVEFKIGKDFDDRVTPRAWAGVAAMRPLRYTRMGPAVRHATTKLMRESARTRLLIVVSDGYPQDEDYGLDRNDREYGLQDTARALADATKLGIETFCLTIDPAGHDYLRNMCPVDRYAVIEDVESLPHELASIYLQRRA